MPRFTSANAREMAARSVAAKKAAREKRAVPSGPVPLPATPAAETEDAIPGISVACVRARLETLNALMSKAKSDREWDNLTRAYDRMFRVWCVLTKTPGPGNRKLAPERPASRQPGAWAVEAFPVPSLPPSCGVEPPPG